MDERTTIVSELSKLSTGERTALRRDAGNCLAEAGGTALSAFFRLCPRTASQWQQECWFSAVTIACLWNTDEARNGGDMAVMLRQYANRQATNGMEGKLRALLDTRWENDGYLAAKLCRLARMLRSDNRQLMPDPDQLLYDLLHWNSDNRFIQLRWAQRYYQSVGNDDQETEEE